MRSLLVAPAIALAEMSNRYGMSAQAHFPLGITDGPRTPTCTRKKASVKVYEPNRADIAAWNNEVERKKARKSAA